MISVEGYLNKIIFHNKDNNYYILSIFLNNEYDFVESDYLSVVGTFDNIEFIEDELYNFKGNIVTHKKYGIQLSAITAEIVIKKDKSTIVSYLSGSTFQGIGKKTAELIVDTLGIDCLDKIYEDKNALFNIKGITNSRKEIIYNNIIANKHTQDIILKLSEYNLSNNTIMKIYSKYKSQTLEIINNNPYYIINDIKGINFKTVDIIAEKIGIDANNLERISAAICYTLSVYCYSNGHTFMKKNSLLYNAFNVLYDSRKIEISKENILDALSYCIEENKLSAIENDIFLPEIHYTEFNIYDNIKNRLENSSIKKESDSILDKYIKEVEEELNIQYDITQIAAIKNSINSNFSIITGGPGTGKTTIILGIIRIFQKINNLSYNDLLSEDNKYLTLCAPTGKAAKRMSESTGFSASTIHKAIGWTSEDENIKDFSSDKSIKSNLVIIDEASMIDVFLISNLLKVISNKSKIILVGDDDQLPSISPGNVLNDLIKSNKIPTVKLNKIFRQSFDSNIINLSHAIKNDINIDILENFEDREFVITDKGDILNIINHIYEKLILNIPKDKIQILAPIYKTNYGINEINKMIQKNFNNNEVLIEYGELTYKVEDRVMQLVNRPEDNIFNGDIGVISDIYKEDGKYKIVIDYDNNFVTYEKQELNQIILAYACSIHKSQGSEFDYVIIPLVDAYNFMLNKNLIYTAITRTKKKLIICGNPNIFYKAIDPNNLIVRNSYLKNFFDIENTEDVLKEEVYILTPKNINFIDPMIGMEDITPFDNYNIGNE
ncbi:SF1B family DNA helicase RecD2 [Gemelliphila palaticanis]|uniref:ATP-dependent RecD2 DNA helicase n=1 Tax=Gemelliphila palaticanis TaxID=81950 RepID=A0ABX2T1M5_9BACL|nr:ATP-dependent RecD-like DNA helicase [Gemella palaticanis]MBF0715617.1 ATP-dependent RecD-like DNA helicase [Gemella palaticanis]NYS47547.1 ATP-dependent RecD-like DNA helicase [Gemella palaticanis]